MFVPLHQDLFVVVDLADRVIQGETTITLTATKPLLTNAPALRINCKRQCQIAQLSINGVACSHKVEDPLELIVPKDANHNDIRTFVDDFHDRLESADEGELVAEFPVSVLPLMAGVSFEVKITFAVKEAATTDSVVDRASLSGVHFVCPRESGGEVYHQDRPSHMFTHGFVGDTRGWFPCVDDWRMKCTWNIRLAVAPSLVAVSCGLLKAQGLTPDKHHMVFQYQLDEPTPACYIGCAVGPFEAQVCAEIPSVTYYTLPGMETLVASSTKTHLAALKCIEDTLNVEYESIYPTHSFVFVDEAYAELQSYTTLSLMSCNLLVSPKNIEQTLHTRGVLMEAVARQFFTHYITFHSWLDIWLIEGLVGYFQALHCLQTLGTNEARFQAAERLWRVCEQDHTQLPLRTDLRNHPYEYSQPFVRDKATLVMAVIEQHIGKDNFAEVLNNLLINANAARVGFDTSSGASLAACTLVSTDTFFAVVKKVTNKDLATIRKNWIDKAGVARFSCRWEHNRTRNMLTLSIQQNDEVNLFLGPLKIGVQDIDTYHETTVRIDSVFHQFDISISPRNRQKTERKRVRLKTLELKYVDLSKVKTDSPVMWVRVNPDGAWLADIQMKQERYAWVYQARFERDVAAQYEAVRQMSRMSYGRDLSGHFLTQIAHDNEVYYRVRCRAVTSLAQQHSTDGTMKENVDRVVKIFRTWFCPPGKTLTIVNDFSDLADYYLMKTTVRALAEIRDNRGMCPDDVPQFVRNVLFFNENMGNQYDDSDLVGSWIVSLALSQETAPAVQHQVFSSKAGPELTKDRAKVLAESLRMIANYINFDAIAPSFQRVITVRCIEALRILQHSNLIPEQDNMFRRFCRTGHIESVRLAGFHALCESAVSKISQVNKVLLAAETDHVPIMRFKAVQALIDTPGLAERLKEAYDGGGKDHATAVSIFQKIWTLMNERSRHDARLRCAAIMLFMAVTPPEFGLEEAPAAKGAAAKAAPRSPKPASSLKLKLSFSGPTAPAAAASKAVPTAAAGAAAAATTTKNPAETTPAVKSEDGKPAAPEVAGTKAGDPKAAGAKPSVKPSQAKPEEPKAEEAKAAAAKPSVKPSETKPEEPKAEEAKAEEAKVVEAKAEEGKTAEAKPANAQLSGAKPDKPSEAKPSDKPADTEAAELKAGDAKPAEAKAVEAKAAEAKAGDAKPAEAKAAEAKAGDAKPAEAKASEAKAGDAKPAEAKAGETNTVKISAATPDTQQPAAKATETPRTEITPSDAQSKEGEQADPASAKAVPTPAEPVDAASTRPTAAEAHADDATPAKRPKVAEESERPTDAVPEKVDAVADAPSTQPTSVSSANVAAPVAGQKRANDDAVEAQPGANGTGEKKPRTDTGNVEAQQQS